MTIDKLTFDAIQNVFAKMGLPPHINPYSKLVVLFNDRIEHYITEAPTITTALEYWNTAPAGALYGAISEALPDGFFLDVIFWPKMQKTLAAISREYGEPWEVWLNGNVKDQAALQVLLEFLQDEDHN